MRFTLWLLIAACADPTPKPDRGPKGSTGVTDTGNPLQSIAPLTELCINEFVADGKGFWRDEQGSVTDWIELHNPTDAEITLGGYYLTDNADDPYDHPLDPSLVVPAGGYLVLSADNLPDLGPTHLPFALDEDGESIGLFRFDQAGEVIHYGPVGADVAWARETDCCADVAGCVQEVVGGSPGTTNVVE
ncbi:MAG: hypothetical protein GWP91_24635 [Rhodobacterales bacterium]|nr:hypothetical protein [Rhodobacterales bacterium]